MPFLLILLVIILVIAFMSIKIVKQSEVYIIERLGKFYKVADAGLTIILPFFDHVRSVVSLKQQTMDIPPQGVITKDNVTITIKDRSAYMDYSVYTVNLKNDGSNTLLLDSRESANTTYIEDANNIKFGALLYENNSDDFYVKPGEQKDIKIKFSDSYREKISINKMVFSDIYLDGTNKTHVEVNFKD